MKLRELYRLCAPFAVGLTEQDAYELQRVLQGAKGFEPGRPGPGGGAPATPFNVAFFLIAVMAGGPRRRAVDRTTDYYEMPREGAELTGWGKDFEPKLPVCQFTGERQFGPALKKLLTDTELAERVEEIVVSRDWPEATIAYRDADEIKHSRFVDEIQERMATRSHWSGALRVSSTLGGGPIHQIAIDLAEEDEAGEWTPKA